MATSVFGLFDERHEAERCVAELTSAGIPKQGISVIASDPKGEFSGATTQKAEGDGGGAAKGAMTGAAVGGVGGLLLGLGALAIPGIGPFIAAGPIAAALTGAAVGGATGGLIGALTDAGVPEEHAHLYAEGVRRGGYLVSVTVDDANANRIAEIMDRNGAVDIDQRSEHWKQQGFTRFDHAAPPLSEQEIVRERETIRQASPGDMNLQVVEEDLKVGKREVERGGVRVRTYVTEKPVEIPVTLREEEVVVQRTPVDRPASAADLETFKEGTVEIREMAEEAVVAKEARVVEEVTVAKQEHVRTENISDTVRRTDVDVQQIAGFDQDFRGDFERSFAGSGMRYEEAAPAYEFGYRYSTDPRFQSREWSDTEADIRREWEQQHPGMSWERFSPAVRYSWQHARSKSGGARLI